MTKTLPYNVAVNISRGAPMGRHTGNTDDDHDGRLTVRRVPLIQGYDGGGAYWGTRSGGYSLFCAFTPDRESVVYFDAKGYRDAVEMMRERFPAAVIVANGATYQPPIPALPVIFRAVRAGEFKGQVAAVFPSLVGDSRPGSVTCYSHVGQHGTCARDYYATTRPATPAEYMPLLRELRGIYEEGPDPVRLTIVNRWTRQHDAVREADLRRMRG